ncbi:MAG TPA: hypothetical protein VFL59_00480 [Candidatus Nanopelagicales bacterium]|nr:hypothetical protein [Candidatus Nanopelagicales bacterium]
MKIGVMPETQVIRARGYLAFCVAVGASGLVASVLALTHRDAADPAWTEWAAVAIGVWALWMLGRARFVGLVTSASLVVHRTWSGSRAYARDSIVDATAVEYVGVLSGRGSQLPLLRMVELRLRDGRRIAVPEVSGSAKTVVNALERLALPQPDRD